ncbi:MAG: hypothetical protein ACKVTZ_08910 [Bacteroidia bacterium]
MEDLTPQKPERSVLEDLVLIEKDASIVEIVKWWEGKRIIYNVIMLFVGILVLLAVNHKRFIFFALPFIPIYGIAANVCYCLGWGLEVLRIVYIKEAKPDRSISRLLFLLGLGFSILVTLLPFLAPWFFIR